MLKFVKSHMESIEGIANYPMISLLIFFLFFVAPVLVGIYRFKRAYKRDGRTTIGQ